MKLLFAASEIFPYAKSGGLADVAASLPKALERYLDVYSVMPLYRFMDTHLFSRCEMTFDVVFENINYKVALYLKERTYFIQAPLLSTTPHMYGENAKAYDNNDLRFGIFARAIVMLAEYLHVDIVHLNDWHTGLAALWIKQKLSSIKTIFSIHNLAYQGLFSTDTLKRLEISKEHFTMDGLEFYNQVSFIKAGIAYADAITTVSPHYAKEILTPKFGCGLEGFLQQHRHKLTGILNGIDTTLFDPAHDASLLHCFDATKLGDKYKNKAALYKVLYNKVPDLPLFVMVSRLAHQKGVDLLLQTLPQLLQKPLHLMILGDEGGDYVKALKHYAKTHRNMTLHIGFDETLSHRIYASADFLLMPSLFEPCGLNQMIAMRYGAIPIVHDVGGLHDTVHHEPNRCGQGIRFNTPTPHALMLALNKALKLSQAQRKQMQQFNMKCDFSFAPGAQAYHTLYHSLLKRDRHATPTS